ncbi:hypothetical protein C8J56DRAFT_932495, partial [Mycena floridula]
MYDDLIGRAKLGDTEALRTLSTLSFKDIKLYRQAVPVILEHLEASDFPNLGSPTFAKDLEIPMLSFSILHYGLNNVAGNIIRPERDFEHLQGGRWVLQRILYDWDLIHGWIEFFLLCLDAHCQQKPTMPDDLHSTMLSDSAGLLGRMAVVSMCYINTEAAVKFLDSLPGYMSLIVQLIMLPAQVLRTTQNLIDVLVPITQFDDLAGHRITEECMLALTGCLLYSPASLTSFQDQMVLQSKCLVHDEHDLPKLKVYTRLISILSTHKPRSVDLVTIRRDFIKQGMVGSITATMAALSDPQRPRGDSSRILVECLVECAAYLLESIRDEGKSATLDALKGSTSIMFSFSKAAKLLSEDIKATRQLTELYTQLLHEITIASIHPAVMRQCLRCLRKDGLLLQTAEPRLQPLVDAGRTFLQTLSRWKSRRAAYNQLEHPLCGNLHCPHSGVKAKSLKYCTQAGVLERCNKRR